MKDTWLTWNNRLCLKAVTNHGGCVFPNRIEALALSSLTPRQKAKLNLVTELQ